MGHSTDYSLDGDFTMSSRLRTTCFALMFVGAVSLVATFFLDSQPDHVRFWSNLLHNSIFFTGVSAMALFALTAFISAWAGWFSTIKRLFEAYSLFLLTGFVLLLIIAAGVWMHWHHLYHWSDTSLIEDPNSANYDKILAGKAAFLNPTVFTFLGVGAVGVWYIFARMIRNLSLSEDNLGGVLDYSYHKKMRIWSAGFLPIAGFTIPAVVWLFIMSVDAHWYSTLFAWYNMAGWFVTFCAFTILTIIYLKGKGFLQNVTKEHLHDLGKYMFGFSVFWTYCWFSQYMLIWYGNIGEETIYFRERLDSFPVLFYSNLVINFLVPFFVLMRNDTKRKYGTLIFVSVVLIFGHWIDMFLMLKPGILKTAKEHAAHSDHGHGHDHAADHGGHAVEHASEFISGFTMPGFLEIGTFLGFLGLFLYVFFSRLSSAKLQPQNDPYMMESVTHHT